MAFIICIALKCCIRSPCIGQMPLHLIKLSACMLKERHDFSIFIFYLRQIGYEITYIRDPNPLYMYNSYMYRRYTTIIIIPFRPHW